MQLALLVIMMGTLVLGLLLLARMGWARRRRRRRLARAANEMGMSFSASDPFGLTRRYAAFALSAAGHSPRAENVIHGHRDGCNVRAFDYHFEAGHGPGRLARLYCVIVFDTNFELPGTLMWHLEDAGPAPLEVQGPLARAGQWLVAAGERFAPALAEAFAEFASEPVSLQTHGASVMLCSSARWGPREFTRRIDQAVGALNILLAGRAQH